MDLRQFRHRHVRDLAWAVFGPSLLDTPALPDAGDIENCRPLLNPQRQQWLQQVDHAPEALQNYVRDVSRLGLYFERLWQFFLTHDAHWQLLHHNLPVRRQGKTLGEFDLIYQDHDTGTVWHLELAVKFYLGTAPANASTYSHWLGPGRKDRLDLKVDHLMQRQTQLAEREEARKLLSHLDLPTPRRQAEVKGYLFAQEPSPTPPALTGGQAISRWLPLPRFQAEPEADYLVLPRLAWLSPHYCEDPAGIQGPDALSAQLAQLFDEHPLPRLVVRLDTDGWEAERFFVTPAQWPAPSPR